MGHNCGLGPFNYISQPHQEQCREQAPPIPAKFLPYGGNGFQPGMTQHFAPDFSQKNMLADSAFEPELLKSHQHMRQPV